MGEVRMRWLGHLNRRGANAMVRRCERLVVVGLRRDRGKTKKYWGGGLGGIWHNFNSPRT